MKHPLAKTANTTSVSQVKSSQVKSSQVKSSQVKSSQVKSSQVKSSQVKSSQVKSNQVKSSQVKSSQVNIHFLKYPFVRAKRFIPEFFAHTIFLCRENEINFEKVKIVLQSVVIIHSLSLSFFGETTLQLSYETMIIVLLATMSPSLLPLSLPLPSSLPLYLLSLSLSISLSLSLALALEYKSISIFPCWLRGSQFFNLPLIVPMSTDLRQVSVAHPSTNYS